MILKKKKNKLIYLCKMLKKKNWKLNCSIIQNSEINLIQRTYFSINKEKKVLERKNCIFGISEKYIEKKSKFSRFALSKITNNGLNQNFKIFE